MLEVKKVSGIIPRSWKKSFFNGITIPTKMRRCNEFKGEILCTTCNNQVDENEEFKANLNLLKRDVPDQFGQMHPYFVEGDGLLVMFH